MQFKLLPFATREAASKNVILRKGDLPELRPAKSQRKGVTISRMERAFPNRAEAGRQLVEKLEKYAGRDDVIVLGLPRGGVPVAYEIAKRLRVPLDVFIVRKLGVPGFEELAVGAIASGGVRVLNNDVVGALPNAEEIIEIATARERAELERREKLYRDDR